jgi:hypothetical protein
MDSNLRNQLAPVAFGCAVDQVAVFLHLQVVIFSEEVAAADPEMLWNWGFGISRA